ncbi:MAG: glycosyltransferase family 4 protein [Lachnospiraceae bacterium]|nr:glycosyltransferase family 4 protein [Lachnospiraceae bacterium]
MKILITTDLYKPLINGVVTSVMNLKRGLEEKGHEVRVLTLSQDAHSHREEDVYYIGSINTGWVYPGTRLRIKMPRKFFEDIIAWKPDAVHSQCELSTFGYAKRIANACKAPLIHTYHTVYENYTHYFCPSVRLGKFLVSGFSRHILNKADAVIAPSRKVGNLLERYGVKTDITVIPSGIDISRYIRRPSEQWIETKRSEFGLTDGTLTMIFIGRLAKEKNVSELLELTGKCKDLPIKLLIVGDGPVRGELENRCKELGITEKVIFAGMVSPNEVGKYYHLGDVFVNASTSETQGLTYAEAMAAGLPMLCKRDECLTGMIKDGVNGWQYHDEGEFRRYLTSLISEETTRAAMADNAAMTARDHSVENFAKRVERLYYLSSFIAGTAFRNYSDSSCTLGY